MCLRTLIITKNKNELGLEGTASLKMDNVNAFYMIKLKILFQKFSDIKITSILWYCDSF